jgi:hypothetical protein
LVNQKFGDIRTMGLVFRLAGNKLHGADGPFIRVEAASTMRSPAATLSAVVARSGRRLR